MDGLADAFAESTRGQRFSAEPETAVPAAGPVALDLPIRPEPDPWSVGIARILWPSWSVPYEHQLRGLADLLANDSHLLAWEPGVGKSAPTAVALLLGIAKQRWDGAALVACPRCVLGVWPAELERHAGLPCVVLDGTAKRRATILADVRERIEGGERPIVVTTYEMVRAERKRLRTARFGAVVADEIHRIKRSASLTARALRDVARSATVRWGLSGTPAPNGPLDWHGVLMFFGPDFAGDAAFTAFRNRYAVYGHEVAAGVRAVVGYRDLARLGGLVGRVAHRLKKTDCLDLPPKVFTDLPVTLTPTERRVYYALREESLARLAGGGQVSVTNVLTEALRLLTVAGGFVRDDDGTVRRLAPVPGKLAALLDWLDDQGEEPIIVWCAFRAEAEAVAAALGERASLHHGGLAADARAAAIAEHLCGERQVLVTTTTSAREGVTLNRAATMLYYSRGYSLTDWLQSQDRCHRIGQTRTVRVVSLVADVPTDRKVAAALARKEELAELLLRGGPEGAL